MDNFGFGGSRGGDSKGRDSGRGEYRRPDTGRETRSNLPGDFPDTGRKTGSDLPGDFPDPSREPGRDLPGDFPDPSTRLPGENNPHLIISQADRSRSESEQRAAEQRDHNHWDGIKRDYAAKGQSAPSLEEIARQKGVLALLNKLKRRLKRTFPQSRELGYLIAYTTHGDNQYPLDLIRILVDQSSASLGLKYEVHVHPFSAYLGLSPRQVEVVLPKIEGRLPAAPNSPQGYWGYFPDEQAVNFLIVQIEAMKKKKRA